MLKWIAMLMCLAALAGCVQKVQTTAAAPTKWEYHVERFENAHRRLMADYEQHRKQTPEAEALTVKGFQEPGQIEMSADVLNRLGAEGWELASSFLEPETIIVSGGGNTRAGAAVLIFKRPSR